MKEKVCWIDGWTDSRVKPKSFQNCLNQQQMKLKLNRLNHLEVQAGRKERDEGDRLAEAKMNRMPMNKN